MTDAQGEGKEAKRPGPGDDAQAEGRGDPPGEGGAAERAGSKAERAPWAQDRPQAEGETQASDVEPLRAKVARLEAEVAEWKGKAMRARADYDNLHRRTAQNAALERDRQKARALEQFLPLAELAQMAASQAERHPGPLSEGVVMLAREFERMLQREGLTTVREVGVPFDANVHEAVGEEAAEGVAPGHVSRIVQPGYRLGDKVLRYAKVAVAPRQGGGQAVDVKP